MLALLRALWTDYLSFRRTRRIKDKWITTGRAY